MNSFNMENFEIYLLLTFFNIVSPMSFKFNCQDTRPSVPRPTSVHKLRPGDIDAVGAIGDSITAGFGLKSTNIFNVFMEWRGLVFSVGGDSSLDRGVATIPNILAKFNPQVYGESRNAGFMGYPPAEKNFNVAVTGANSELALTQAKDLVNRMKNSMGYFYYIQWKLITIYLGQNDHCEYCYWNGTLDSYAKAYQDLMLESLDYLHDNMPRALVQVVGIINPAKFFLHPSVAGNPVCEAIHDFTCDCIVVKENLTASNEVHEKMNNALRYAAVSGRYDTKQDFTVVYQPTFSASELPKKPHSDDYDLSYLGHDCFHPNYKLHLMFSAELWETMLTPINKRKTVNIQPKEEYILKCPTWENPYLATTLNSIN